jgi:hypothetical protein
MMSGMSMSSVWKARLARGVALFFVLFVFFDIAFPESCAENTALMPAGSHARASSGGADDASPANAAPADHRREQQPGEQAPHEGDCLGCCGHVLPVTEFHNLGAAEIVSLPPPPAGVEVPTPSLRNPYHPPRIS